MKKDDLRIIFMGTPEFAVGSLQALVDGGYNVVAVVTQPDKPVGRHGSVLQPSQVKQYALSKNIPVLQPEKMKDEAFVEELRSYNAELQVVVAFRMLPEVVWDMPRFGTFNVHASLLPQYRGAAPINWAIINGETETGITTFFLDHEIDTGRIIFQEHLPISDTDDVGVVYDKLMVLGAEVCLKTVDEIIKTDGNVESHAQLTSGGTLDLKPAPKIFKETCRIDWSKTTREVYNFVRGLSPYPAAWTTFNGQPLKIFKTHIADDSTQENHASQLVAKCSDGLIIIDELQLAGKKRMLATAFLNGLQDKSRLDFE
ncbi:MAG: methionyl-tRNA formyltransferase [Prevotellaceae bacterium]|nr:methionyl-tRNA formyltransferase [Prevotellaceae bacterium]